MSDADELGGQLDQFRAMFRSEAREMIDDLEAALLDFEEELGNRELVDRIFRIMHTIKGSGAMHGFDDLAGFTHHLETVYDRLRSGKLQATAELVQLSLLAKDHIRSLTDGTADPAAGNAIEVRLGQIQTGGPSSPAATPVDAPPARAAARPATRTYRVRFRPHPEIFSLGGNPLPLVREVCELGHGVAVPLYDRLPDLSTMDPETCYVGWDIVLETERDEDAIRDVFLFVEDRADIDIRLVDGPEKAGEPADYVKLGDILVERGDMTKEAMDKALRTQKRAGEIFREEGLVTNDQVKSALAEQEIVRKSRAQRETDPGATNIRVPAGKLDDLIDLVGELVIAQARLSQAAADRNDPIVHAIAEDLHSLTSELQDNAMSLRMLPIGATFSRMRRLVRDLSGDLGKEVELVTAGGETELDKTVIEHLGDPMVHLIRNCIDHGIESPADRRAAGKPAAGTVRLSAEHSEGHVVVRIEDDGKGIDPEVIRAKGVERGLIAADSRVSDREVLDLVFAPGFSTAKEVSAVSGRGVGMDVVKRSVDSLRGSISLSSRPGKGTTVTIRLPLTLAILDVLRVRVGPEAYMVPLAMVEECVELTAADIAANHGREVLAVREHIVPYVRLRDYFGVGGTRPAIEQVVIASFESERYGFVVDQVVGQVQAVMKSLGKMCDSARGLAGATILGDGTVALIVDPPQIIRTSQRRRTEHGPAPAAVAG